MNLIINIFQRLFGSPKTTAGGVIVGTGIAVAVSTILDQAGCQFSNVQWFEIMSLVAGGPALVGGLSTDNAKAVVPISPLTGTGLSMLLFGIIGIGLVGCASYIDYGNGRYGVTRVSEERSPFGTNAGWTYLDNCEGYRQNPGSMLEFKDCRPMMAPVPISSQGQGGQIVGGALTGLGFGLGSAFSGATGATSTSTSNSISNAAASGGKGH